MSDNAEAMSDDLVNSTVEFLKQQKLEEQRQAHKASTEEATSKTRASQTWHALREKVRNFCTESNAQLGETAFSFQVGQNTELQVLADLPKGRQQLQAHFDAQSGNISYTAGNLSGTFRPVLEEGEFYYSDGSDMVSVEKMRLILVHGLIGRKTY